jgi:hypothetical protein
MPSKLAASKGAISLYTKRSQYAMMKVGEAKLLAPVDHDHTATVDWLDSSAMHSIA